MNYPVLAAVLAVISIIFIVLYVNNKRKIRDLSERVNQVLNAGEYENVGNFDKYKEGELAVLESEIGKLFCVLNEQAQNLQKDKLFLSDSLADITHQLKTPLTSINIVLSMLMDDNLSHEARLSYIEEISGQIGKIDWLVHALLKISRMDANTVVFEQKRVEFGGLIEQIKKSIEIPMELKGQKLILDIQPGSGFTGDYEWSREAVMNIVKNCMEQMDDGLNLYISAHENVVYSDIIIEDEGRGIDSEDLPHIFERFYRGKRAGNTSVGIGLHLARTIIVRQNGTLKASNRAEGGARFEIRFYKQIL